MGSSFLQKICGRWDVRADVGRRCRVPGHRWRHVQGREKRSRSQVLRGSIRSAAEETMTGQPNRRETAIKISPVLKSPTAAVDPWGPGQQPRRTLVTFLRWKVTRRRHDKKQWPASTGRRGRRPLHVWFRRSQQGFDHEDAVVILPVAVGQKPGGRKAVLHQVVKVVPAVGLELLQLLAVVA